MHICVVAPSACVEKDAIQSSQQALQNLKIHTSTAQHLYAQHRYLAGTSDIRLGDLRSACANPQVDALWCARGGTGAAQLLPQLDDWLLNKPLIGYSDSSALLNYIAMRGGQAIHGPVFQEIAYKNRAASQAVSTNALQVLQLLNQQSGHYPNYPLHAYALAQPHQALFGQVLGGNLTTLCSLQGTPWAVKLTQPTLLLLEDVGEAYYRLERHLVQLLQSIDLNYLQAVVIGEFYQCPQKNVTHSLKDIFAEHLRAKQIPMFDCNWFGHGDHNQPFWIGKQARIENNQLVYSN